MLSFDSVLHERTKHIEVDIHFIKEKVQSGVISLVFVFSCEKTADMFTKSIGPCPLQSTDMFTKSIGPGTLQSSLRKLGLVDIFTPT